MRSFSVIAIAITALCSSHVLASSEHGSVTRMTKRFAKHARSVSKVALVSLLALPEAAAPITTATIYNTTALFFYEDGVSPGACMKVYDNSSMIVGLPAALFGPVVPSNLCGQKVFMVNTLTGKNATLLVGDASQNLYTTLTTSAYAALGGVVDDGMFAATFYFTNSTLLTPSPALLNAPVVAAVAAPAAQSISYIAPLPASASAMPDWAASSAADAAYAASTAADAAYAASTAAAAAYAASTAAAAAYSASTAYVAYASSTAAAANLLAIPTPVASAPAAKSGGNMHYGGHGTWFTQNGVAGACGAVNVDSAFVIAIDQDLYNGGAECGRSIAITRVSTGQTSIGVVADMCPTCDNSQSLDMSVGLFSSLASQDVGMFEISWKFV